MMLKHYLSINLLFFFLLISSASFAQGYLVDYNVNDRITKGYNVIKTPDGGYLMATGAESGAFSTNYPAFIKTTATGDTISTNLIEGFPIVNVIDFIEMNNGNYLCLALALGIESNQDFILLEVDAAGQYIDDHFFANSAFQRVVKIEEGPDGSFYMLGKDFDQIIGVNLYIQKMSATGTLLWRSILTSEPNTEPTDLVYSTGDELFVTGHSSTANFRMKVDPEDGVILTNQSMIVTGGDSNFYSADLLETADGNFVCLGNIYGLNSSENQLAVLNMNGDSSTHWFSAFTEEAVAAIQILENEDGSFVLLYFQEIAPYYSHYFLKKIDSEGVELWTKELTHFDQNAHFTQITHDGSGGYVATGSIGEYVDPSAFLSFIDSEGNNFANLITGSVYHDANGDCDNLGETTKLKDWIVSFKSATDTYFTYTDHLGNYIIDLDLGEYQVNAIPQSTLWDTCLSQSLVLVDFLNQISVDIPVKTAIACPELEANISTQRVRGCQETYYTVAYCNYGSTTAENSHIEVELDPAFEYVSSSLPLASQDGLLLTFDLSDIGVYECGTFIITVAVSCDVELGQTHCVSAHIYPDAPCTESPDWSGARVEVRAVCENNETVRLEIENVSNVPMLSERNYIVIEDDMILFEEPFELGPGEIIPVTYAANGKTFRIEAGQEFGHPGSSMPSAAVEGCGGFESLGFINWFPQDDADDFIDIDCIENVGSYDPNDKSVTPRGYGDSHFINKNTPLTYKVRFQNTGTDTAYLVVVRDTLSEWLDISTLRKGASSHAYELTFENTDAGTVLKFTFENINLLAKAENEAASQGYFMYKINQKVDLPLETVIENTAGIYFDQNSPIVTNTVFNTIGEHFVEIISATTNVNSASVNITVSPNPFTEEAVFELTNIDTKDATFLLYNTQGQIIHNATFENGKLILKRGQLPAGVYSFMVVQESEVMSGKLVIN